MSIIRIRPPWTFLQKSAPFLVVPLGPFVLIGVQLLLGKVLFWGTPALQFVPWFMEAFRQLSEGQLPLWNNLNGFGAPLIANYQTALFYPPNWLLFGFAAIWGGSGVAWGYTFLAMLHLIWAGMGMVVFLRRLGVSALAQAIGACAFALCGYLVARLEFFSMIWAAAWLPWILRYANDLASPAEKNQAGCSFKFSFPLALCLGMMFLAGHAQLSWYTLLLAGMWVLAGILRGARTGWYKPLLSLGAHVAIGCLIAAVQLLPTAEYLLQSQRSAEVGYAEAMTYSFSPWRLVTLFAPDFFGNPGRGDFWGYASYWEDAAYIGLLPLFLAVSTLPGLFARSRERGNPQKPFIAFLWIVIFLSFLLALGQNTFVFPFLYRSVPTFSLFQAPARYLFWAELALVVLAALGVDRWYCPEKRGLYWLRLGTAGAFAVTLGAGLAWLNIKSVNLTFIRATALAGFWALGAGGLTLLIPYFENRGRKTVWSCLVFAWVLADLISAGWLLNPTVPAGMYGTQKAIPLLDGSKPVYLPAGTEYLLKFKRFLRFEDYRALENYRNMRTVLLPNLNMLDRIPLVTNFDPIVPARYAAWMKALETLSPVTRAVWLWNAGVGAFETIDASQAAGVQFYPIQGNARYKIFSCASWAPNKEIALSELQDIQASRERLVLEGNGPRADCRPSVEAVDPLVSEKAGSVRLEVDNPGDGWFFAPLAWFPGWTAKVDGAPAAIVHANYLFMAVQIPKGKHEILLKYSSMPFIIGALFSILITVSLILWKIRRATKNIPAPRGLRQSME